MLETGALGVTRQLRLQEGRRGHARQEQVPSRMRIDDDGDAQELSGLDQKGCRALLSEQRVCWRNKAHKAAAAADDDVMGSSVGRRQEDKITYPVRASALPGARGPP